MTANYVDNVPLASVAPDPPSGLENGLVNPAFDPTSDNGTTRAFATVAAQFRNTASGQRGIFCAVCHTSVESRYTVYHNWTRSTWPTLPA